MPRAKGAREHRDNRGRIAAPRHGAGRAWMETRRVRAPFDLQHAIGRHAVGQDLRAWRDDQIRLAHLPVAPAPHRLRDERAIERGLGRAGVVDDGRVDLERESRAGGFRRQRAFAAEVVVPLDDHVRPYRSGKPPYRARTQQAKLSAAGRRAHGVPVHGPVGTRPVAPASDRVDVVAERGQSFGDSLDMYGSAQRPRHPLIQCAVEDPHLRIRRRRCARSPPTRQAGACRCSGQHPTDGSRDRRSAPRVRARPPRGGGHDALEHGPVGRNSTGSSARR